MACILLIATLQIATAVALAYSQSVIDGHRTPRCLWDAVDPLTPDTSGICLPNSYYWLSGKVPAPTDELGASYMEYMFANETDCNQEADELSCRNSLSNCAWNEELYEDNAGTAADPDSPQPFVSITSTKCVHTPVEEGAAILNSQPATDALLLGLDCSLLGSTSNECSSLKKKGCAWDGSHCMPNSTMELIHFMHRASKTPFTRALVTERAECSARATKAACVLASEVVEVSPATFQQNLARAESGKPAPSSSPAPAVISSVSIAAPDSGSVAKVTGNSIICIVLLGIAMIA